MRRVIVIGLVLIVSLSVRGATLFQTNNDSTTIWTRDADPRSDNSTQKRGTLPTLVFGAVGFGTKYQPIFLDTIVFTGDTLFSPGNGIPSGKTILSCTLWLELSTQTGGGTGENVFDLYSVTQSWDENNTSTVSWDSAGGASPATAWTTGGGTGVKHVDDAISMTRIHTDSILWKVEGVEYCRCYVPDGDSMPVVIPDSLAQEIYEGTVYGIHFRRASGGLDENFQLVSSEHTSKTQRPQWHWWYEDATAPLPSRRRRMLIQNFGAKDEGVEERWLASEDVSYFTDNVTCPYPLVGDDWVSHMANVYNGVTQ